MNAFDRVVSFFAPEAALRRETARVRLKFLNSGYGDHGASTTKKSLLGWRVRGASPKEDIEDNVDILRERSRDLYMGTPLATGAIKTLRTNVVGSGLRLNPQVDAEYLRLSDEDAEAWEAHVEREFALWADSVSCDAHRMNNFFELQQLAFLSWLVSGDVFGIVPLIPRPGMPYDIRIQLVEADRVCSPPSKETDPKVVNGVELGPHGEIVAYYIAQHHPGSYAFYQGEQKWVRVEAFGQKTGRPNILHLMESERPEQRRGVPVLAPVVEALKQLGRYTEAELMAAVISGFFTVFVKSTASTTEVPLGQVIPEEQQVDSMDPASYELGNGSIIALGENESIETANPGRPNTAFDGFVSAVLRQVGAGLEIPYELLIKHFSASYSASRAALLEAWKMFKMRRAWLASDFCQPIYEEWLAEAVAKGRVKAPGFFSDPMIRKAYSGAEWSGPSQGQLDPLKEVNAAGRRVQEGFSTRARETIELTGGDWKKNYRQRVREEKKMREGGLKGEEQVLDVSESDPDER